MRTVPVAALISVFLLACRGEEKLSSRNILLVTLCSFRADHVGAYGYSRDTTPILDEFAKQAVLFDAAYSNATFTNAAHATIFTGLYPGHSGLLDFGDAIRTDVKTLPELLTLYGYRVHALLDASSGYSAAEIRTMSRGFGEPVYAKNPGESLAAWIDADSKPWLAWVHIRSAHAPYGTGAPFTDHLAPAVQDWVRALDNSNSPRGTTGSAPTAAGGNVRRAANDALFAAMQADPKVRENFMALYDSGLRTADADLGALLAGLGARLDNAVVVVVGDHGEALGEERAFSHQGVLSDAVFHVPLEMKIPGMTPQRVTTPASLADLMPTLASLAGISPPVGLDGMNLLPLTFPARPILAQAIRRRGEDGERELREAVIAPPFLYLEKPGVEQLWQQQPSGWQQVTNPEKLTELRAARTRMSAGTTWNVERKPLTPEQLQQMQKNGYW